MNVTTLIKPLKSDSFRTKLLDDSLVLYDESSETVHILNQTGAAIWGLCDGNHDVEQLAKEIARLFGKRPVSIRDDVLQMVEELQRVGLVSSDQEASQRREDH